MTTFTSEDRLAAMQELANLAQEEEMSITALSGEMRTKFEKQFPDLIDNHIAWMCFREGWQRGAESAYAEAYHLDEWEWK